uniref:CSON013477 protein n=1 Tax=Culicoides sonorensis TaxID=179676 RepID=A0A336K3H3_CULSO
MMQSTQYPYCMQDAIWWRLVHFTCEEKYDSNSTTSVMTKLISSSIDSASVLRSSESFNRDLWIFFILR